MSGFNFKIFFKDKRSNARKGVIYTPHGNIQTPAFVAVGTQASVKSLDNQDLEKVGTQVFFVNTYHQYLRPGVETIKSFFGLHNFIGWSKPLMTDSAGFQVFSLGDINRQRKLCLQGVTLQAPLVKISDEGVTFRSHLDGSEHFFTPEKSVEIQAVLGADIMIAFDECCYYPAQYGYAKKAMERTHRWAVRCLEENVKCQMSNVKSGRNHQALYGVVQGGMYKDLRRQSAKFIADLPFEGMAIGGVSVGESKSEMTQVLDWVVPLLPEEKPRHLLGVGEIDDIFNLVERGVDTFDCVMPTRLGRMGFGLRTMEAGSWKLDITKKNCVIDKMPIDEKCECFVCQNYSRAYLHHLFRAKELSVYRLLTFHNLWFMEKLLTEIRRSIEHETFLKLKRKWLEDK